MVTLYGIRNCDTMKKAANWFEDTGRVCAIHDYRRDGLDEAKLKTFVAALGWEALLNTRGTTWRKLDDAEKESMTEGKAVALMLAHVAIIKRPVWECDGKYMLGFAADDRPAIREFLDM